MNTNRKSGVSILAMAALLSAGMTSCSSDNRGGEAADGTACLNVCLKGNGRFSRALSESDWNTAANYNVEIINSSAEVIKTFVQGEMPERITVPYGTYTVRASYGEQKVASRDTFLSTGETTVNVASGEEKTVNVECAPTCGKVMVQFDASMATYYSDYYVDFTTPQMPAGTVAKWVRTDTEPWYLAVGETGDKVTATIHLTPKAEYDTNKTHTDGSQSDGTIVRQYTLQRNKAWTLKVTATYDSSQGEMNGVRVTIDESVTEDVYDEEVPITWM